MAVIKYSVAVPSNKASGSARLIDSRSPIPRGWGRIEIPQAPQSQGHAAILEGLKLNGYEIEPKLEAYLIEQSNIRTEGQAAQAARAMSQDNDGTKSPALPVTPEVTRPASAPQTKPTAKSVVAAAPEVPKP